VHTKELHRIIIPFNARTSNRLPCRFILTTATLVSLTWLTGCVICLDMM